VDARNFSEKNTAEVGFFGHYFRVCEKKSEKNVSLKHLLNSFIN